MNYITKYQGSTAVILYGFNFNYMVNYMPYHCVQVTFGGAEVIAAWKINKFKKEYYWPLEQDLRITAKNFCK